MLASNDYKDFIDQISDACSTNPGLTTFSKDGVPGLRGTIELYDDHHAFVDSYSIAILATDGFPRDFPLVFETGNKIPKNYDWHVYETDGHCCIKTIPEEMLACKKGITLNSFIETEIKPYLFNQTFRRVNGYFYQERSHGLTGWIEYFKEVFKTANPKTIVDGLKFVSKNEKPNRSALCFCGSGIKYRKCHREAYENLSKLSPSDFDLIFSAIGIKP
ncbi:SEC-C domain-containing protein [Pedobacter namyangjuensis]|uniref:SEC-C domain-containing protein n=1 Tax=Pedobacter namyangjuensis TaxID=600626 RepID=UPI000DE2FB36|nr:SEC-C domain-containing protein [Pedobacter namyangjuensis]